MPNDAATVADDMTAAGAGLWLPDLLADAVERVLARHGVIQLPADDDTDEE